MGLGVQTGALLLLIAAVVAMLTRRLRLPYSVGLVAAGIGIHEHAQRDVQADAMILLKEWLPHSRIPAVEGRALTHGEEDSGRQYLLVEGTDVDGRLASD